MSKEPIIFEYEKIPDSDNRQLYDLKDRVSDLVIHHLIRGEKEGGIEVCFSIYGSDKHGSPCSYHSQGVIVRSPMNEFLLYATIEAVRKAIIRETGDQNVTLHWSCRYIDSKSYVNREVLS